MIYKISLTIVMLLSFIWALLPGGFGLSNYRRSHTTLLGGLAILAWILLVTLHPAFIYLVWSNQVEGYMWVLWIFVVHVFFFATFGRDVSTG